jgi:hypothetical protein
MIIVWKSRKYQGQLDASRIGRLKYKVVASSKTNTERYKDKLMQM